MRRKGQFARRQRLAVAGTLAALTLTGGCTETELRALLAGLEAAARILETQAADEDVSFQDWLASELND